ncbi:MAG: hypothetical protein JWL94_1803 [Microbacteriaceae bacterium]|jgi:hypothetical protein|nr:hypothetical protein [Microbacteriaceae bacterium]HEV7956602.1 type IV toxin-antitoxin system AbiEi family antitoxin [Marisediminicola sp.]
MTRLLPSVLSSLDLPQAELHAARLDGEVFSIDECFAPVDEVSLPISRARSLAAILPPRLIAEQRSSAWVLGALHDPPARHQLCADSTARYQYVGIARATLRQVVLESADICTLGGLRITAPLRTAIDLARFSDVFDQAEHALVLALAELGQFELGDVLAAMDRRRNLPGKSRAAKRLGETFER